MPTDDLPSDTAPDAASTTLTIDAAIELLRHGAEPFPTEAVALLYTSREAATAPLLDLLTAAALDPQPYADDLNDQRLLAAICILTAWEEPAAFQPLLAVLRLPAATLDDIFSDIVTEFGGPWLAAVAGDKAGPIAEFVADPSCDQWARMAALNALVRLVHLDRCPRDTAIGWLGDWMRDPQRLGSRELVAKLALCAKQLAATELTAEVTALYDNNQVARGMYGDLADMLDGMTDPDEQEEERELMLLPVPEPVEFLSVWWPSNLSFGSESDVFGADFAEPKQSFLAPAAFRDPMGPPARKKDPKAKTKRKMAKQSKKRNRGK